MSKIPIEKITSLQFRIKNINYNRYNIDHPEIKGVLYLTNIVTNIGEVPANMIPVNQRISNEPQVGVSYQPTIAFVNTGKKHTPTELPNKGNELINKEKLDNLKIQNIKKTSLVDRLTNNEKQITIITKQQKELEQELSSYSNVIDQLQNTQDELSELKENLEAEKHQENEIEKVIYEKCSRIKTSESELNEITSLGNSSTCPKCKQTLGNQVKVLSTQYVKEITELKKQVVSLTSNKRIISKKIQFIQDNITNYENMEKQIRDKINEKTKIQTKINGCIETLNSFQIEKSNIEKELSPFSNINYNPEIHHKLNQQFETLETVYNNSLRLNEHVKDIPKLNAQLESIKNKISKLKDDLILEKNKLKDIGFNETKYQEIKILLNKTREQYNVQNGDLIKQKQILEEKQHDITRQKQLIDEETKKLESIEKQERQIKIRKILDSLMNDFKVELISEIRPRLSLRTSQLFNQMTNGRYPSIELSDDYSILIHDRGTNYPIERFSGGEIDLANLCLRIAISQEISSSSGLGAQFIVLDEVFGSQDAERKQNILQALKNLTNQFNQVLLITHVEDVNDQLPFVFHITENSDNTVSIDEEGNLPLI